MGLTAGPFALATDGQAADALATCKALPAAVQARIAERLIAEIPVDLAGPLLRRQVDKLPRRTLEEEAAVLMALASDVTGTDWQRAAVVERRLRVYSAAAWRFDRELPAPHNPRNADLHGAMKLFGRAPSKSTIQHRIALFSLGTAAEKI
jgi:hypothetical protein